MKRRKFVAGMAGMAAWPLVARAQQPERMRRIGLLTPLDAEDSEAQARLVAFTEALEQLGWNVGQNIQIVIRSGAGQPDQSRKYATELVALEPDVILATGGSVVGPLLQVSRTVPVVFTQTPDPVEQGFVESLSRPGGNATGFTLFEYDIGGKWLGLLKEVEPSLRQAAILHDPAIPQGRGQLTAIQSVGPSFGVVITSVSVRQADEIERAITEFALAPNGGLIVTASGLANVHRGLIIALADRHRLPAVCFHRLFATDGGLISYGPDSIDPHRRAAGYVDRILRGEKPANLPVLGPTKFELVINLRTAKAIGRELPSQLLARADEVIE